MNWTDAIRKSPNQGTRKPTEMEEENHGDPAIFKGYMWCSLEGSCVASLSFVDLSSHIEETPV